VERGDGRRAARRRATGGQPLAPAKESLEPHAPPLQCGSKLPITIGKVRRSPTITCGDCGATIDIDGSPLDGTLAEIDRRLDDFPKEITIRL
jgi:hypothetical protein